jgi:ssDNA-binding replication factor A large subunit
MEGVSLDVPMPKPPPVSVLSMDTPSILNKKDAEIIENPEDEELKMNPFAECVEIQYTPIAALSNNTLDWIIKARVTKKYEKKTWSNPRGTGYLLNVDLIDQFGT